MSNHLDRPLHPASYIASLQHHAMALSQTDLLLGLLIGGLLFIFYLGYRFFYAPYQLFKSCGIKGPTPTAFYGNYNDITTMNLLERYECLSKKYGPVTGYYIGRKPRILITDLDILKQILVKDFDNFSDRVPFPNLFSDDSKAESIAVSRGEKWRKMRKTLSPSFSASKLKIMLPLLKRSTDNLVAVIGEKAASEESFEVFKVFSSFTMETILATAFGRQVDLQRGESDQLSKSMQLLVGGFTSGQVEKFILLESHFPWLFESTLMKRLFSFSEPGKAAAYIKRVTLDLVKARRETENAEKCKDILQLMIEASGEEGDSDEEKETEAPAECPAHKTTIKSAKGVMTDAEVVENSFLFLFAGNETTATSLSFAAYFLAVNPDIQEKLQSEIDAYFEDKPESNLYTAAQKMTYLDNVIQETLRLHPPAPNTDRYCNKTTVINGVTIPKDATIIVPIVLLHHSPLYWKDPEKFDPDRFTPEERTNRPQLCHMPFGFGPRSCLAMRLALLEAKIALIELLKRYTFIRALETEVPLQLGLTMRPKNGIHLKVIRRQHS